MRSRLFILLSTMLPAAACAQSGASVQRIAQTCSPETAAAAQAAVAARAAASVHAAPMDHSDHAAHAAHAAADTTFATLQQRGQRAMGVDQYTSVHRFEPQPCGGRIELQRDSADTAGVAVIRAHLEEIAAAFAQGDFQTPGFVHAQEVPGTAVMAALRERIDYTYRPLPGGGEVVITSNDVEAIVAIHEFLAFQRMDHRAGS